MTSGIVQQLLGCQFGRDVFSEQGREDSIPNDPCLNRATRIVEIHAGDESIQLKLCDIHRAWVDTQSTPRG